MGGGEDLWAGDPLGRLADGAEEVLEHAGVALDRAAGAAAALLLGQEGVQGSLPAGDVLKGRYADGHGRYLLAVSSHRPYCRSVRGSQGMQGRRERSINTLGGASQPVLNSLAPDGLAPGLLPSAPLEWPPPVAAARCSYGRLESTASGCAEGRPEIIIDVATQEPVYVVWRHVGQQLAFVLPKRHALDGRDLEQSVNFVRITRTQVAVNQMLQQERGSGHIVCSPVCNRPLDMRAKSKRRAEGIQSVGPASGHKILG
jgi:hypothetical protein